jgi:branched-chain amino acid transport system ATP-binding protein
VDLALEVASYAYVLQVGRSVLSGTSAELLNNPDVQRIYLGVG